MHLSARGVLPALCVLRSGGTRPLQGCRRTPQFLSILFYVSRAAKHVL